MEAAVADEGAGIMEIDRVQADRAFAILGFALSFLFLLAVVAFACTIGSGVDAPPPSSVAGSNVK